jgi:hypothetical protein
MLFNDPVSTAKVIRCHEWYVGKNIPESCRWVTEGHEKARRNVEKAAISPGDASECKGEVSSLPAVCLRWKQKDDELFLVF